MTRYDTTSERPLLSKWWRTESAQKAMARAADARREKITAMRAKVAEKKERIAREAMEWIPTGEFKTRGYTTV